MRLRQSLFIVFSILCIGISGCSFHSTAKDWNGLSGHDGKPKYYKVTNKMGFNLLIGIPLFGDTSIGGLVNELTEEIAKEKGNHVQIVHGRSENYWYGFPPFTWIITPVSYTVAAEYEPYEKTYQEDQKRFKKRGSKESEDDSTN